MNTLNQAQKDLIVGTLLGDGNLQTATHGRTWRYRALHKEDHLEYIQHKYDILAPLCGTGIAITEVTDDRNYMTYYRCAFSTKVHDCLRYYGNMFYTEDPKPNPSGGWAMTQRMVKDVPRNIHQVLTPRALAYLYMDDGSLKWLGHSNAMRICTESFTHGGTICLARAINKNFGVAVTLQPKYLKTKNVTQIVGYRIVIPERSAKLFVSVIKPYLVPCMQYKVSDGNRGHL